MPYELEREPGTGCFNRSVAGRRGAERIQRSLQYRPLAFEARKIRRCEIHHSRGNPQPLHHVLLRLDGELDVAWFRVAPFDRDRELARRRE
jgi:hypothetical protein